jgi:TPR repeat protein
MPDRTEEAIEKIDDRPDPRPFKRERQALFDQPYIDPLTDYLEAYAGDTERASIVRQVEDERERRCESIAGQYASEPATEAVLERYRAGYSYSCPEQVSAFAERVSRDDPGDDIAEPVTDAPGKSPDSPPTDEQALGDCYLLTSIRNYSAAREACLEPAQAGDTRSQANMALIAHAFEDYASALEWAEKAAPASSEAGYLLGRMYASGQGVEQDMEQAVYWYSKAAGQGNSEAKAALDRHREKERPVGDT